ncbi:lysozyme inhibitor LprI family protein [Paraurantiacibacter namhicola]|uniref:Lysozyme inhibitor LprI-like N-terminal domain-containing protein n=1 Tax=Paraurantiacibacter namhicola TaxID=645517 RepID=A0A1C7D7D7_9SPHN|nr:lysozyme inhibitor LprI family protein [Paraurantiacibacter namhicola]ANU07358.1 hypothetical protein A6F65_01049 [Paraurantiacibacter namhicola]
MTTLATLTLLIAAAPAPAQEWNCENPLTQSEMNYCAHQDYKKSDARLNEVWSRAAADAKARDADNTDMDDGRPGYFETLLEGQRSWLAYRDAHCRMEGYEARGGSLEPLLVATCKDHLTQLRSAELEALLETY